MSNPFPSDVEYLVFTVNKRQFGVLGSEVVSVINMPDTTAVPNMPDEMRGVISFQNGSTPLLDLRVIFGDMPRNKETEELVQNMALRRQDHINWLNKLKDEVFNDKPITVQTDPSKCKFGIWYDKFQTDNGNLRKYMDRFDAPHQEIHHVAVEAAELIRNGQRDQAKTLVRETEEGVLARLLSLFDGIAELVKRYLLEYAIAFEINDNKFAMAVDDINFFSCLEQIQYPLPPGIFSNNESELVRAIGRYQEEGEGNPMKDVMLLDMSRVVTQVELPA